MKKRLLALALVAALVAPVPASACDLCAVYSSTEAKESRPGFNAGVFEQFTHFGTMQLDGVRVPNVAGQYLDSSITQFIVGYRFSERFGVQVNIPYIHRSFKRPDGFGTDRGTVSGLGDLSLVGNYRLYERMSGSGMFICTLLGGVKFPTGDTSRIKEELTETAPPPGAPESGIHGHDLTLGSGSVDGIVGMSVVAHYNRSFATAAVHYTIRSTGDFGYRFADDLIWSVKPGYFLLLTDQATVGLQFAATGEAKGKDTFMGASAPDTGTTSVFLGPELSFTYKDRLSADIGADFPVMDHNTALQAVPDYRVRAAVTLRF